MGNNAQNPVDDESDMQVTLSLDDGSEVECAILTIFELEEQNYIALLPLDEDGNDALIPLFIRHPSLTSTR